MTERRALVQANTSPSMRRQCELLSVSRSSVYYEPVGADEEELALMRRIDELHLKYPFFGSRSIARTLRHQGTIVNRKRVQRLMRLMGLESVAPKPATSKPAPEHPVYPYLLRGLTIGRPNQVWASDITYIPMARGFAYLVAIIDWYSRRVLAWRLSNTLEADFCVEGPTHLVAETGQRPHPPVPQQGFHFRHLELAAGHDLPCAPVAGLAGELLVVLFNHAAALGAGDDVGDRQLGVLGPADIGPRLGFPSFRYRHDCLRSEKNCSRRRRAPPELQ